MKNNGNKSKKTATKKLKPTVIHLKFTDNKSLSMLENIKKLTGMSVGTKAVSEALENYPQVLKRADGLNDELIKVNRDYEQQSYKMESIKRAFGFILDVDVNPKEITG